MSLAGRTVRALSWKMGLGSVTAVLLLIRTALLTRWIAPQHFGTYTLAYAIVAGTGILAGFGLSKAFLHRSPETFDEQRAAATHFTLLAAFASVWCVLLVGGTLLFAADDLRTALLVITPAAYGIMLTETPRAILTRRVVHRRLALLTFATVVVTTTVALPLARAGAGLWALLATDLAAPIVHVIFLYGRKPVWKPRLEWSPRSIRYFIRYGGQNVLGNLVEQLINRLDDIWTGAYLGRVPLGYYSRAYAFARHPTRLLSGPVAAVAGGTYAELKGDRLRLSKAFFRITAFLTRAGFFVAGLGFLLMPEFIQLILTETWRPMLPAFRLMLVFMLLSPIAATVADLYVAIGNPRRVVNARLLQLMTLVCGLFTLGTLWGIVGVAFSVDLMLMVGIGYLLWDAERYVDYSWTKLLLVPAFAFSVAVPTPYGALWLVGFPEDPWITFAIKALLFSIAYVAVELSLELKQLRRMLSLIRHALGRGQDQNAVDE